MTPPPEVPSPPLRTVPWAAGVLLQAIVLGLGLFLALLRMLQLATDASVFRYQGF